MSAERRGCKKLAECYVVIDFYKNVIRIKRVRFEFRPPGPTKGAGGGWWCTLNNPTLSSVRPRHTGLEFISYHFEIAFTGYNISASN